MRNGSYQPIENYGIIGDLNTVALVGMDGSIDFMCYPRFDSPSIFAALLDREKGGRFQIAPVSGDVKQKQLYLPDTNILFTRFLSEEGVSEISDFMTVTHQEFGNTLIRRAKAVRGEVHFNMICRPGFNYARSTHRVEQNENGVFFISEGPDLLSLRLVSDCELKIENGAATAGFTLGAGESVYFILEEAGREREPIPCRRKVLYDIFRETVIFWRNWINRSNYNGLWSVIVKRSALTLKMMTSQSFGSMIAAPTFGLPEEPGGERNWDYRYTWIRDASFTLYGLIRLGFTEEAASFMRWIAERCHNLNPDGSLQIMYGIDGRKDLSEEILTHLEGYRGSRPVRIGNEAYRQLQLDIYGELMDSVYLYDKYGQPLSYDLWQQLVRLIEWVCLHWHLPDEGIWEVRSGRQEFLYSRLMCWTALDRAIRLSIKRSFPAPLDRWIRIRNEIYRVIFEEFWSPRRRSFVQHRGSITIDAATLLMPLVRFISPTDPRWLSTLEAIEEDLLNDSLVYRYKIRDETADGMRGEEGTFSMCSFWYVECLSRSGRVDRARFYFEKMLGYANHLGLYAEELGPRGEHLGNFPQAFTHLGLISAAFDLDRQLQR